MKTLITLTPDELAQLVAGVAEYNGYAATGLAIYKGDQLVDYDRVVIEATVKPFEIRVTRVDPMDMLRKIRASYGQQADEGDGDAGKSDG